MNRCFLIWICSTEGVIDMISEVDASPTIHSLITTWLQFFNYFNVSCHPKQARWKPPPLLCQPHGLRSRSWSSSNHIFSLKEFSELCSHSWLPVQKQEKRHHTFLFLMKMSFSTQDPTVQNQRSKWTFTWKAVRQGELFKRKNVKSGLIESSRSFSTAIYPLAAWKVPKSILLPSPCSFLVNLGKTR